LSGFVAGHQANFDGFTNTRGGFGAEFCAIIGRYSKAMVDLRLTDFYCSG